MENNTEQQITDILTENCYYNAQAKGVVVHGAIQKIADMIKDKDSELEEARKIIQMQNEALEANRAIIATMFTREQVEKMIGAGIDWACETTQKNFVGVGPYFFHWEKLLADKQTTITNILNKQP